MTKEEVLTGALALNANDKNYTVTVEGDRIITTAQYSSLSPNTFRSIACLNDDNTYVELQVDDRHRRYPRCGKAASKSVSYSFEIEDGKIKATKENTFNSKDCKKLVRDYLAACGYKRTNKGFFRRLFGR